jgi:riboflavin kinase/FMN adenylyltransferase
VDYLRPELKFSGLAALKAQIEADAQAARDLLADRHFPESPGPFVPVGDN